MKRAHSRFGDDRAYAGLLVLVVAAAFLLMAFLQVVQGTLEPETQIVKARFATAQQLKKDDPVRIHGVKVGQVDDIELQPDGREAIVSLAIEPRVLPLHRDAKATITERNLLGGSLLVNVDPGDPTSGELGDAGIPRARTSAQVELEDLQSLTRGSAEKGMKTAFSELATALQDPQHPDRAIEAVDRRARDIDAGLTALRGEDPDRDLRILIRETGRTVSALDTPTDHARRLVGGLGATLETVAARQVDVRSLFATAPGVMRRSSSTLRSLDASLSELDPLVSRLRAPAGDVAPALRALRPTVLDARALLDDARPLLRSLRPASRALVRAARTADPLLKELDPGLRQLAGEVLPYLNKTDPRTGRTTAEMVGPTFGAIGSGGVGQVDNNGHMIRFGAQPGEGTVASLPCRTYLTNPDAEQLAACDSLQTALQNLLTYSPQAVPGSTPPDGGQP